MLQAQSGLTVLEVPLEVYSLKNNCGKVWYFNLFSKYYTMSTEYVAQVDDDRIEY